MTASCRESYGDADGILKHLSNVDVPLKAVLDGPADMLRLEVHAPAAEVRMLPRPAAPHTVLPNLMLWCTFFDAIVRDLTP